jgi:hypothetical protein
MFELASTWPLRPTLSAWSSTYSVRSASLPPYAGTEAALLSTETALLSTETKSSLPRRRTAPRLASHSQAFNSPG